ncbi:MAG TPA: hypothetical protein VMF89_32015, partial [Polyangiales bacterium]|nr:hypothetical protein [Polyangiales bacterium]
NQKMLPLVSDGPSWLRPGDGVASASMATYEKELVCSNPDCTRHGQKYVATVTTQRVGKEQGPDIVSPCPDCNQQGTIPISR